MPHGGVICGMKTARTWLRKLSSPMQRPWWSSLLSTRSQHLKAQHISHLERSCPGVQHCSQSKLSRCWFAKKLTR